MFLLLVAFIAGALTVLAPCVLPLLPVIIGGTLSDDAKHKSRPYIIAGSLAASVIVFTLLLKASTLLINLSPNVLDDVSGGLIIGLGLVSALPEIWDKLMVSFNWTAKSEGLLGKTKKKRGKYLSPILIGAALGPVFSSCSPTYAFILASVLPGDFWSGLIYLVTYSAALVITLLLVSLLGRKFIKRMGWAINPHSIFRRALGILFIAIGVVIISGQQVKTETWIGNHLPFDETRLEQVLLAKQHKSIAPKLKSSNTNQSVNSSVLNVQPTPAPEFAGLTNWINSGPLTMSGLRGKVVLVDFWTYSCVNCNRALPYVEKWYQAYQKQGLVVVGVHTPEFAFEHVPANVQNFVKNNGITYPVALDNDYDTWGAFDNDSWPADYLIDKSGNIRYIAIGEGDYDKTEEAIQALLGLNAPLQTPVSKVPITATQTPETYFGADKGSNYGSSPTQNKDGSYLYTQTPRDKLPTNAWTLGGNWQIAPEYIASKSSQSTLTFNLMAKDVYVVAGSTDNQSHTVTVDLPGYVAGQYGSDDPGGKLTVNGSRLYHIASLSQFTNITLILHVPVGVSLYTFTFGS